MSRSSTPLATTRSKMERASRDTKKKSPLPHDDQAPRREGIFVLGEQDQAVVFDAALRQDWDSITRIYDALDTERDLSDMRTEYRVTLATRLCGKSPAEMAQTEADKRAARRRKARRSRQQSVDDPDTINDSTATSQLPAIEQKLRNPLAAKRAVKGMRRTVAGHTALHLAARAHAPPEVIEGLMKLQPAAIRARDRTSQTPLHLACCGGVPYKATRSTSVRHAVGAHAGVDPATRARAVVDALLSQESSDVAGAVDESGRTPVELAVVHQLWTCVESLVEACPRAVARADHRETPLWALAKRHGATERVMKALEEAHPRENMTLIALIRCGFWLDAINAVREQGAHSKDTRDRTPLHVCAMHPDAPVGLIVAVKESWPQAANQRDKAGWLPLHHSAHHGGPADYYREVEPGEKLMVDEFPFMVPRPHEDFDSDDERFIRQVVAEEEARRAAEAELLDEEGFMD